MFAMGPGSHGVRAEVLRLHGVRLLRALLLGLAEGHSLEPAWHSEALPLLHPVDRLRNWYRDRLLLFGLPALLLLHWPVQWSDGADLNDGTSRCRSLSS